MIVVGCQLILSKMIVSVLLRFNLTQIVAQSAGFNPRQRRSSPVSLLAEERRFRIREILSRERTVTASDLIRTLGVTAATIRRDLAVLEKEGVLARSHGGAVSRASSTNFQPSYDALGRTNRAEKQAIAREAERLILDGGTIFVGRRTSLAELALDL